MIKTKLQYSFILPFLLISQIIYCSEIDSLNQLLTEKHDVWKKIEIYTQLVKHYKPIDIDKSKELARTALDLSLNTGTPAYLGEIYALMGDIAVTQDSLDVAKKKYEIALAYFIEDKDYKGSTGVTMVLGNIAFTHDDIAVAMHYYIETINSANLAGMQDWLPSIYLNIGLIHIKTSQFIKAQGFFTEALEGAIEENNEVIAAIAYENLGKIYLEFEDLNIANDYFNKALGFFIENEMPINAAVSYHNMAQVENKSGQYQRAIQKLLKAEELLKQDHPSYAGPKQPVVAFNKVAMGVNKLLLLEYADAYRYLLNGLALSKMSGQINLSQKAAEHLSKYWEQKGNADSALFYFKVFKNYTDSLNIEENIRKLAFQEAQFKYEQELLSEKQARETESEINRRNIIILIVAVILLILVLIILSLLLKLSRNRTRQAELEQENLKAELELRNKELTTHLIYQVKNNEFILNISKKLKELYSNSRVENKSLLNEVIREIELDASTDQWEEFEIRFQQVHTDFYRNIGEKHPDLSSNELRLCAFLKLNMNTKDIAAITYQSTNSITVARWRLRQKFSLKKEESLTAYLTQF